MRAKPDMKPWVSTDKSKMSSVGAALKARVLGHLLWDCAAPTGLKECVSMPNPGLAPWAMKSVALTGLMYVVTTHQLLGYFDALAEGLGVGL